MASRSLALLCHDSGIPERQKQFFCSKTLDLLTSNQTATGIALASLGQLWARYDDGGISHGRSPQSALLEETLFLLEKHSDCISERARVLLSVLLGMYHDHGYMNAMEWYDYELEHFSDSDLMHRVWLSVAAFSLEIDDVANMSEWPIKRLLALLREN